MLPRTLEPRLQRLAQTFRCLTVTGPRQSGKTTLCRALFDALSYANLELPDVRAFALEDPRRFLSQFPNGAVLDEVQRAPELFSYLQADIDERPVMGKWVLSGSQNFLLLERIGQSLAGRSAVTHLLPFEYGELRAASNAPQSIDSFLLRGGFPALYGSAVEPTEWLGSYVNTYVERDVRQMQRIADLDGFQRFLGLCAGRSGQDLNVASLASDAGLSHATTESWLSVLEASFVTFRVRPYLKNVRKRLVKRPRLFFLDTGLLCYLLRIRTEDQLRQHPLRGSIFETWVASEIHKAIVHRGAMADVFFYRDQHGVEVDLIIETPERTCLVEVKAGGTYRSDMARSLSTAQSAISPDRPLERVVVYAGSERQARAEALVLPWAELDAAPWMSAGAPLLS